METGKAVALAGITATALVGIAGATASWLIARDDRANQRVLAHESRVYDRRADVYLAALAAIELQRREIARDLFLDHEPYANIRLPTNFRMSSDTDADLSARLTAFGSPRVVAGYARLHSIADRLYGDEMEVYLSKGTFRDASEREEVISSLVANLAGSLKTFELRQKEFQRLVQKELS